LSVVKVIKLAGPASAKVPGMTDEPAHAATAEGSRRRPAYREGREALLDATVRVVARDGLRGLTYRAVGAESGTTHGLVSYHFGTRQKLVLEAARHATGEALSASSLAQPTDRFDAFAAGLAQLARDRAEVHAFLFELALESRRNPALRPEVLSQYEEFRAATAAALAALGVEDPDGAGARLVFAAIDGLTLQQLVDGDEASTEAAVAVLRRALERLAGDRG
jgi:AcrR family transcriptional regulator